MADFATCTCTCCSPTCRCHIHVAPPCLREGNFPITVLELGMGSGNELQYQSFVKVQVGTIKSASSEWHQPHLGPL